MARYSDEGHKVAHRVLVRAGVDADHTGCSHVACWPVLTQPTVQMHFDHNGSLDFMALGGVNGVELRIADVPDYIMRRDRLVPHELRQAVLGFG